MINVQRENGENFRLLAIIIITTVIVETSPVREGSAHHTRPEMTFPNNKNDINPISTRL